MPLILQRRNCGGPWLDYTLPAGSSLRLIMAYDELLETMANAEPTSAGNSRCVTAMHLFGVMVLGYPSPDTYGAIYWHGGLTVAASQEAIDRRIGLQVRLIDPTLLVPSYGV